ncbi:MAG: DUF1934 domain-containing protein [Lachnospiraceae bacterium]|nr:DUF1934 domain-containing protein [Lachnospiraceae bacterium]
MNKEVLVSIKGIQTLESNQDDSMEIVTVAEYYLRNNKHYIMYEDWDDETKTSTKNLIKISDDLIEIQKRGTISTNMTFKCNEVNKSFYQTPFGDFSVEIDTKDIEMSIEEKNIDININYSLAINDQHVADNNIIININER